MARVPSLRRPVMETMKAEAARIRKRQEFAQARLDRGYAQWGNDPDKAKALSDLEEAAALSEREVATLEAAAKVAALLERVPEKPEDDEEKPLSDKERAEVVARASRSSPAPLTSTEKPSDE